MLNKIAPYSKVKKFCPLLLLLGTVPFSPQFLAQPQNLKETRASVPVIHIEKLNERVVIDGRLDEPVWQQIAPITSFTQTDPDEGKPASERTEVRIFYDDKKIYFGFRCFDRDAGKIVARFDAHDARTNSDSVDILLDTFHDLKSGYFFSINARGVQYDATVLEQSGLKGFEMYDSTWNAVWEDATTIDGEGWTAEVAIPFKILRFPRTSTQEWGINLGRSIVRRNEDSRWVFVARFDEAMRPSKSGVVEGLHDIEPGHALDVLPSITSRFTNFGRADGHYAKLGSAGLDVKYGLTSNLVLDATVNPDFSQAEADEFNLTVSRFELFFPEKRQFFNEGMDNFKTPLNLFFTRRIGAALPDGEPQRILAGAKITGKMGAYKIGFLDAGTVERNFFDPDNVNPSNPASPNNFDAPAANFFVLRVARDILKKSSIGFITVNRDQQNTTASFSERATGVDANFLFGDHITWSTQLAVSSSPRFRGSLGKRIAEDSQFAYNSKQWEYHLHLKSLGEKFDVEQIGFEPETNRWGGSAWIVYKPFINRYGIRQLFIEPNYDFTHLQDGRVDDSGADFSISAQFKNFWSAGLDWSYDRVRFNRFTPDHLPLPDGSTRIYVNPKYVVELSSNENRQFSFSFELENRFRFVNFPFNFQGRTRNWYVTVNWKIGDRFRTSLSTNVYQERFLNGAPFQNRASLIWHVSGNLTRKWRARLLAQYSSEIDPKRFVFDPHISDFSLAFGQKRLAINSLLAYDFNARSALFIGYNSDRFTPNDPTRRGKEIFLKLSYLFSF
ncbi:MAG: carbohydrate binding family 9 domain-containing protein [Acidobacteriia bacterium]|nr:carbohydrate binding family 9 domain-containing protein [Terriglobia bacterium]